MYDNKVENPNIGICSIDINARRRSDRMTVTPICDTGNNNAVHRVEGLGTTATAITTAGVQPASLNYTGNKIAMHCIARLGNMICIYINISCRVINEP